MRFVGLALLFAVSSPAVAAADVVISSANSGYSILFPVQPEREQVSKSGQKLTTNVVRDGDNVFLSSESIFDSDIPDVQGELEADVANYIKAFEGGKLTAEQSVDFITTAGTALPSRQFSFDSKIAFGKGIVVASGRRAILVGAMRVKPNGKDAPNEKFLASFKIDK